MIARSFIFLTALFSILTAVAGLEYDAGINYFPMEKASYEQAGHCALHAMRSHAIAARLHAKIDDPGHQDASKAHASKARSLFTASQHHMCEVRHNPPKDNKGAFESHVANGQRAQEHRASRDVADEARENLQTAEAALLIGKPTLANTYRDRALRHQPA